MNTSKSWNNRPYDLIVSKLSENQNKKICCD